jgi:hypothetical protein
VQTNTYYDIASGCEERAKLQAFQTDIGCRNNKGPKKIMSRSKNNKCPEVKTINVQK